MRAIPLVAALSSLFMIPRAFADISDTYVPPYYKQGVTDGTSMNYTDALFDARYARFAQLGTSNKTYNIFWRFYEMNSHVPSSPSPVSCPADHMMVPDSVATKNLKGYKRFRCLRRDAIADQDEIFTRDKAMGIQSTAVLWSAPQRYRAVGCNHDACVPRDDAMDDWEDWVNFLADRYSSSGSNGMISHFIVWNEAAGAEWFDYSPVVPRHRHTLTADEQRRWLDKYAAMMQAAHRAIRRNTSGVLLHASTDALWEAPPSSTYAHMGTRNLLEGLWQRLWPLGMSAANAINWSVAVHPYGDPLEADDSWANFQNLATTVATFQLAKLRDRTSTPYASPQWRLIASEQGWERGVLGSQVQARNICEAHAVATRTPSLMTVSHLEFQHYAPDADPNEHFGIVPESAGPDLAGADGTPGFEAYRATSPSRWLQTDAHLCCTEHNLGCRSERTHPLVNPSSNNVLWSAGALTDRNPGSIYSSNAFPTSINTNGTVVRAYLPPRASEGWAVSTVRLRARMENQASIGFPHSYHIWLTAPDNSSWIYVGFFQNQPDSSGVATIALPRMYRTYGITVQPQDLATNAGGNYFQLAEIELSASLAHAQVQPFPLTTAQSTSALWPAANAIDGNRGSSYSSQRFPTDQNSNGTSLSAWISSVPMTPLVSAIRLRARMSGATPLGFPKVYAIRLTAPDNTAWIQVGTFQRQPGADGTVLIELPKAYQTWGVMVLPLTLGADDQGGFYFQLAELEMLP